MPPPDASVRRGAPAAAWLAERDDAEEFVEAVGLGADTDQRAACLAIAHEWNDAWESNTYVWAADETIRLAPSQAGTIVDCPEILQVRKRDVDRLRVEPVVLRTSQAACSACWGVAGGTRWDGC